MKKIIWLLIAVIIVAGLGVYFLSDRFGGTDAGTESWKTYSNSVLGFEVKHPESWRHEECTYEGFGIVGFGDSSEPLLICNSDAPPLSYINVQVGAPAAEFDRLIQNTVDNLDNVSRINAELDGRPAVKISGETRPSEGPGLPAGIKMTMLSAKEDGKVYSITHWNLENEDHLQEYEKMASSFKFLGGDTVCIQVITAARNPQTGETRDFPTPCDVPEGWEIMN